MIHLKDRDLQNELDALCLEGELFSEQLQTAIPLSGSIIIHFGKRFTIELSDDMTESSSYNPKVWNNFPQVIPPLNTWMRTEFASKRDGRISRNVAKYELFDGSYQWFTETDESTSVDRFKPWYD